MSGVSGGVASGLVRLKTEEVRAPVSEVLFEDIPISAFRGFRVHLYGITPSADATLRLQTRRVGQPAFDGVTTDYQELYGQVVSTTAVNAVADMSSAWLTLANIGTAAGENANGFIDLQNLANTSLLKPIVGLVTSIDSGGTSRLTMVSGACRQLAAQDAFRFFLSTGKIEAGVFELFGIKGV